MKILHLETSSRNCSVAASDGDQLLCICEEASESYQQSEKLHTFVEWALEGAGLKLKDLDAISLGSGPGSYTGLRIGAATAKGFCYALDIPLVAVNSLATLAAPFIGQGYDIVIPLVDARRMEVYAAAYDGKSGEEVSATENLILNEQTFEKYRESTILFVGDGAAKARDVVTLKADYRAGVLPSAKYLVKPAFRKAASQHFEDVAYFEPFYLKEFFGTKKT